MFRQNWLYCPLCRPPPHLTGLWPWLFITDCASDEWLEVSGGGGGGWGYGGGGLFGDGCSAVLGEVVGGCSLEPLRPGDPTATGSTTSPDWRSAPEMRRLGAGGSPRRIWQQFDEVSAMCKLQLCAIFIFVLIKIKQRVLWSGSNLTKTS
jgi:hypothetical protein